MKSDCSTNSIFLTGSHILVNLPLFVDLDFIEEPLLVQEEEATDNSTDERTENLVKARTFLVIKWVFG